MNPNTIVRAANPVADTAFADAWRDAEGRAAFERIVATERDHRPRRRVVRRRLLASASVAVAAGTAAVVIGIPGLTHDGAAPAWSVTKNPDGTVVVRLNDYRDPAGLQARLRAAGVRANVETLPQSCYPTKGEPHGLGEIGISADPSMSRSDLDHLFPVSAHQLAIDPRYLPLRDTIWIGFPPPGAPAADQFAVIAVRATAAGASHCLIS
jgi:hypothetical protein